MATATELARKIYPRMVTASSSQVSSPAPHKELAEIARRLYPSMKSSTAPPPSQTTERAGFYKRVMSCDMKTGRVFFVDVPAVSRRMI